MACYFLWETFENLLKVISKTSSGIIYRNVNSFWKNLEHDDIFWCKRGELKWNQLIIILISSMNISIVEEVNKVTWTIDSSGIVLSSRDIKDEQESNGNREQK